ncbi:hypothetical protein NE237_008327 [Protea cynaroides]|uniref:Uncharacterized protein n=1 Tax=Protea cynaroides TaxID=273540 RepID=A0A9Q0QZK1_9MAGN|nr:hypothetical protein NE237_008327 [Protea cynaroides]
MEKVVAVGLGLDPNPSLCWVEKVPGQPGKSASLLPKPPILSANPFSASLSVSDDISSPISSDSLPAISSSSILPIYRAASASGYDMSSLSYREQALPDSFPLANNPSISLILNPYSTSHPVLVHPPSTQPIPLLCIPSYPQPRSPDLRCTPDRFPLPSFCETASPPPVDLLAPCGDCSSAYPFETSLDIYMSSARISLDSLQQPSLEGDDELPLDDSSYSGSKDISNLYCYSDKEREEDAWLV